MARLIAAALVCAAGMLAGVAADAAEPVRVVGIARGFDAAARDQAIHAGLREAVMNALEALIPVSRVTPYEAILARPGHYIEGYRLLDYDARDGMTTVELAVHIRGDALRADAAMAWLADANRVPQVLVMAGTRGQGGEGWEFSADGPVRDAVVEVLTRVGLEVLPGDEVLAFYAPEALAAMFASPEGDASRLARALGCDGALWILAERDSQPVNALGTIHESTARVAMWIASAHADVPAVQLVAESMVHGESPAETAEAATTNAAARLAAQAPSHLILAAAAGPAAEDAIRVRIDGKMPEEDLRALAGRFAALAGVESVETLIHGDRASRLAVRFPGNPAAFIEPALRTLPESIAIVSIVDRDMHLRAQ